MRLNQLSGSSHSFECPSVGRFKWGTSSLGFGSKLELSDSDGTKLARLEPGARLELMVSCNDFILDLIVTSGMAVAYKKGKDGKGIEAASEVISALAGS